jgi:quercetin dioxygenase-like cupin family protein
MDREPVVVEESAREWNTGPDEEVAEKGSIYWKTLLSADLTRSEALTIGIAKIPPNEALHEHRHRQAEIYLLLEGTASVTIEGKTPLLGALGRAIHPTARVRVHRAIS